MESIQRTIVALSLLATGLFALSLAACGDPAAAGCRIDGDCRSGRICEDRQCVDKPVDGVDAGELDGGSSNLGNVGNNVDPNNVSPGDMGATDAGMGSDMGDEPDMNVEPDMGSDPDMETMPDMDPPPVFGPQIEVSPAEVEFGFVPTSSSSDAPIRVANIGDDTLTLTNVALESTPSQGFSVNAPNTTVAPGDSVIVTATFAPNQEANFGNAVVIESNDSDSPQIRVPIGGRGFDTTFRSCLFTTPTAVDFGPVSVGQTASTTITVGNCAQNDDVDFDSATLVGADPQFSVASAAPVTLSPGDTETITVTYTPTSRSVASQTLRIESDAQLGRTTDVSIRGGGGCAEPVALAELDSSGNDTLRTGPIAALVNTTVNLDGSSSSSPSGGLDYDWSVVSAPAASNATLSSTTTENSTFTPDVAGDYIIELDATDPSTGAPSCGADRLEITALASRPDVRVSLEWEADHDFDLHVLRDDGNGNFPAFGDLSNDLHYDALWLDWGATNDRGDDGYHFGDDSDGDGPEVAIIGGLEAGRTYRVVAHFARADGFQPAVFDVDMTINRGTMGPGQGSRTESRTFNVAERGLYWIVYEIEGSTGRITYVNQATQ